MYTYLKNTIISILCLLSAHISAQNNAIESTKLTEWLVLKNRTTAFADKNLTIKEALPVFHYKEKLYGTLLKDTMSNFRNWVIEIKEGNKVIYFPFPELVQNIKTDHSISNTIGKETVDIIHPLPIDYKPNDLEMIDQKWNYHAEDYPKYLRKEVIEKLIKMFEAAEAENIHLRVVSAFRAFEKQRNLYLKAISTKGIQQIGTAKPAHSEHQLGTTIDITSLNRKDMLSSSFDQTPEGHWLKANAQLFGFTQSYTKENSISKGYMPEPWHFRYVGPN